MGSSPVTATTMPEQAALPSAAATVARFFDRHAPLRPGSRLLAAFSGGADSCALLIVLRDLAARRRVEVLAAHLDHGLDAGSHHRARRAAELAEQLEVPLLAERRPVHDLRRSRESPEAAARRVRYAFLEECRRRTGACWLATGHHRDDQVETVLLRLLFGTGLDGLGGIEERRRWVLRPLLGLRREVLHRLVEDHGLRPVDDPTNRQLEVPRNHLRHRLLPALRAADPGVEVRCLRLARAARAARGRLDATVAAEVRPRPSVAGASLVLDAFTRLPDPLRQRALGLLHRQAGQPYPPRARAVEELLRQLAGGPRIRCDCGSGWQWVTRGHRLLLRRTPTRAVDFAYTLKVPGEVAIPEVSASFGLRKAPVASWMFRGARCQAAFRLPLSAGGEVTVRNRRPGDRIVPFGSSYSRRLKEVLIDHKVPRDERDRLPLLVLGDRLAWVPGVTIHDDFKLPPGAATAWVAEVREQP